MKRRRSFDEQITPRILMVCSLLLLQVNGLGAEAPQYPAPQPPKEMAKPSADMSAKCQAMMAEHDKVMAEVQADDQRLGALVATMNAASGEAKVAATADVVAEIVAQRKTMRERMMKMQMAMMGHMTEHMHAGPGSGAMCPMMKMGSMKH